MTDKIEQLWNEFYGKLREQHLKEIKTLKEEILQMLNEIEKRLNQYRCGSGHIRLKNMIDGYKKHWRLKNENKTKKIQRTI